MLFRVALSLFMNKLLGAHCVVHSLLASKSIFIIFLSPHRRQRKWNFGLSFLSVRLFKLEKIRYLNMQVVSAGFWRHRLFRREGSCSRILFPFFELCYYLSSWNLIKDGRNVDINPDVLMWILLVAIHFYIASIFEIAWAYSSRVFGCCGYSLN